MPDTVNFHTNLKYKDLMFRVESSTLSHLVWLEEFLTPQFQIVGDGFHDCKVTLIENTSEYEEVKNRGPQPDGAQLDCFVLDNSVTQLPAWTSVNGRQVIFDKPSGVFYLVSKNHAEVRILTPSDHIRGRMSLMRVLREFAMKHSQRTALVLHSSAFAVGDKGVIIAGPKRSGKTTLLIHALRQGTTKYLSNDRVVASFGERGPMLRGMPTLVSIRQPTVEMFPYLRDALLMRSYHHHQNLNETAERSVGPTRPGKNGNFCFTPAQFCSLLEVAPINEVKAWALVLPRVTQEKGGIELESISPRAASDRLGDALFGGVRWKNSSDIFGLPRDRVSLDQSALEKLSLQLTSEVRCFDCRLGTEAYDNENLAVSLINQLLLEA